MPKVFQYKPVVERLDYLEVHAAGAKSILGIVVSVLGLLLIFVTAGFLASANMRLAGWVLLAVSCAVLSTGVPLMIIGFIRKKKIIVDGQGKFIGLDNIKVPFDEIDIIELHTIFRTWRDMNDDDYFERMWIASLLMKKDIPVAQKMPSFMLKELAAYQWVKKSVPLFQACRIAISRETAKEQLETNISERSSAPEFYDLAEKIAKISGLRIENKIMDDLKKEGGK